MQISKLKWIISSQKSCDLFNKLIASAIDPEILEAFNNASALEAEPLEKDFDAKDDGAELSDDFIRLAGGPLATRTGESSLKSRIGHDDGDDIWGAESDSIVEQSPDADREHLSAPTGDEIDTQLDQLLERDYADDDDEMSAEEENSEQHTLDPSNPQLVDTLVEDLGKFFAKKCVFILC